MLEERTTVHSEVCKGILPGWPARRGGGAVQDKYSKMTPSLVMSFTLYIVEKHVLNVFTACACDIFCKVAFERGATVLEAAAATVANEGAAELADGAFLGTEGGVGLEDCLTADLWG